MLKAQLVKYAIPIFIGVIVVSTVTIVGLLALNSNQKTPDKNQTSSTTVSSDSSQNVSNAEYLVYSEIRNGLALKFLYPKYMSLTENEISEEMVRSSSLWMDPVEVTNPPIKLELAITIYDNTQRLSLNAWIEAHTQGSKNYHGLPISSVVQFIEDGTKHKSLQINGNDAQIISESFMGIPGARVLVNAGKFIVSLAYPKLGHGEISVPFTVSTSSLSLDGQSPQIDENAKTQIDSFIESNNLDK
jgi:hypothetical protein